DAARTRTAVISRELNERLFGGRDSTGAGIRIDGHALRVAGVVDGWAPKPKFYDSESGHFDGEEHVFVPLSTALDLGLEHFGSSHCYGDVPVNDTRALNAPCVWLHYWVELADAAAGRRPLRASGQRAPARRPPVARPSPGGARRRAHAALAGDGLPGGVPDQYRRPAAGQVPAPQRRDRRAPGAGRIAAGDLQA